MYMRFENEICIVFGQNNKTARQNCRTVRQIVFSVVSARPVLSDHQAFLQSSEASASAVYIVAEVSG